MENSEAKIGLVLAGGGAKGAYQAGVLRYLAEMGFAPDVIAGTSIGALNGAILSSYQPFTIAVKHLNSLWEKLGESQILYIHPGIKKEILSKIALSFWPQMGEWLNTFFRLQGWLNKPDAIFDIRPIDQLLRDFVDPSDLRKGIELWATVFPSLSLPEMEYDWVVSAMLDFSRRFTGVKSHWLRVQDCNDDETVYKLLLASAAIPLAFPKQEINGRPYVDGGLVDNIPFGALAKRGCTHVIVIHLSNGSIWNRYAFPGQTIIEVRPEIQMRQSDFPGIGLIQSILDFSPDRIALLKKNGYMDAERCLEPIIQLFNTVQRQRQIQEELIYNTNRLANDPPLF